MAPRFALEPVDLSFFDSAPHVSRYPIDVAVGPDELWAELTARRPLSWCRMLTDVEFQGAPPFGAGATRKVEVAKVMRMDEHFFHWDDAARRHSFYVTSANVPLFRSFAEDYQVTAIPGGSRLTWTFAMAPRNGLGTALRLGAPLNKALYSSLAGDTRKRFGPVRGAAGR